MSHGVESEPELALDVLDFNTGVSAFDFDTFDVHKEYNSLATGLNLACWWLALEQLGEIGNTEVDIGLDWLVVIYHQKGMLQFDFNFNLLRVALVFSAARMHICDDL